MAQVRFLGPNVLIRPYPGVEDRRVGMEVACCCPPPEECYCCGDGVTTPGPAARYLVLEIDVTGSPDPDTAWPVTSCWCGPDRLVFNLPQGSGYPDSCDYGRLIWLGCSNSISFSAAIFCDVLVGADIWGFLIDETYNWDDRVTCQPYFGQIGFEGLFSVDKDCLGTFILLADHINIGCGCTVGEETAATYTVKFQDYPNKEEETPSEVIDMLRQLLLCSCDQCIGTDGLPMENLNAEVYGLEELLCPEVVLVVKPACAGILYDDEGLGEPYGAWTSGNPTAGAVPYEPETPITCDSTERDLHVHIWVYRASGETQLKVGAVIELEGEGDFHTAVASRLAWPLDCHGDGAAIPVDRDVEENAVGPFYVVVYCEEPCSLCMDNTTKGYWNFVASFPEDRTGFFPSVFAQCFRGPLVWSLSRDSDNPCRWEYAFATPVCGVEYLIETELVEGEGEQAGHTLMTIDATADAVSIIDCTKDFEREWENTHEPPVDCSRPRGIGDCDDLSACFFPSDGHRGYSPEVFIAYPSASATAPEVTAMMLTLTPEWVFDHREYLLICQCDQCWTEDRLPWGIEEYGLPGEVLSVEIYGLDVIDCDEIVVREKSGCEGIQATDGDADYAAYTTAGDYGWRSGEYATGSTANCTDCTPEVVKARVIVWDTDTLGAEVWVYCDSVLVHRYATAPESRLPWPVDCSSDVSIPVDIDLANGNAPVEGVSVVIPACVE